MVHVRGINVNTIICQFFWQFVRSKYAATSTRMQGARGIQEGPCPPKSDCGSKFVFSKKEEKKTSTINNYKNYKPKLLLPPPPQIGFCIRPWQGKLWLDIQQRVGLEKHLSKSRRFCIFSKIKVADGNDRSWNQTCQRKRVPGKN